MSTAAMAATAPILSQLSHSAEGRHPNVILVLTDDQGWDDIGLHGNKYIETPRLDALGRESVQFANFYVAAVCAPTRTSLLTGRHFLRTGVAHVHGGKDFIHPDEILLGELFQQAGYRTAMFGKWHSGKTTGYFPWERGFDEAYMAQLYQHRDSHGEFNGQPRQHTGWTVDTLTDYALQFIEQNRSRPFFLFLPYLTVHAPLVAPDELVAKYRAKGLGETLAQIYAMIDQLDGNIGRILDALDRHQLADDTIVVFLSDNGPQYFGDKLLARDLAIRYASGYKGHKGDMWENGIKSPLFVRWPKRFQPHTVQRLTDVCDLFPTLLGLCGIKLQHVKLDGRNVSPYLDGNEKSLPPKESFIYVNPAWPPHEHAPGQHCEIHAHEYDPVPPEAKPRLPAPEQWIGLRTEEFKLLQNPGTFAPAPAPIDGRVLIHITEDPKEDRNVLTTFPAVGTQLTARVRAWFDEIKADPHAFHTPVFVIGAGASNVVYLYGPLRMQAGMQNSGLEMTGWGAAEYQLRVRQAGRYAVTGPDGLRMRVAGGETVLPGVLTLPAGDLVLTVDLPGGTPPPGKTTALHFRKLDS